MERVALVYPTQQTRDTAFIEMGRLVSADGAEQAGGTMTYEGRSTRHE